MNGMVSFCATVTVGSSERGSVHYAHGVQVRTREYYVFALRWADQPVRDCIVEFMACDAL